MRSHRRTLWRNMPHPRESFYPGFGWRESRARRYWWRTHSNLYAVHLA